MLARIQQVMTMMVLAASAAWVSHFAYQGHALVATLGAAAFLFGYAAVLAIEFVWMACVNRAQGCHAGPLQLLSAWWGEVRIVPVVFCWRQPFRSGAIRDHLPKGSTGRRAVLFVHGFVCNRGVWTAWLEDLLRQGIPFVAVNLEPVFGAIEDYVGIIDAAVRDLEDRTAMAPVVVAHSMGGLAVRRWWIEPGNEGRIHHLITLGTPHSGTRLARMAISRNGRQMREASDWLRWLHEREPSSHAARMTCYWSSTDNIVFPAATATLRGADNRPLHGCAHLDMVEHHVPRERLAELL